MWCRPRGGGGIGLGAPPAISMGAMVGAAGFTVGWAMGTGMFTMLACACGAIAHIVDGTGANGVTVGGGGKEYGGGETPKGMGTLWGVEESLAVGDMG